MPPTQTLGPRAKKAQKCVFFIAGLSYITGPKNKKLQNNDSFLFYIHVPREKSTTYAKFVKISKKKPKNFFGAAGLSKQLENTIIRCVLLRTIFYICILADINMHAYAQFWILWQSSNFKKIQIQFLEHREVIWPQTKK